MNNRHFRVIVFLAAALAQPGAAGTQDWDQRMAEANRLESAGRYQEAGRAYLAALERIDDLQPGDWRRPEALNNLGAHYYRTAQMRTRSASTCAR